MTTSGTSTFNQTRNQIIKSALRKVGAVAAGETPDAQTITDASDALNAMVKRWNAKGIHLWTETEAILFLEPGQVKYQLATGSPDHCTGQYYTTETTAAAIETATVLTVDSTFYMTVADYIGVVLNEGTIQWSTIVSKTSTTVTIADALTDSVAADADVFTYTSPIVRPLRVPFARRYNIISAIDTPLLTLARKDYFDLPNKLATGIPTNYYYDPQLAAGYMYIWPAPVDASNAIKFTWYRPIQDFDISSNTPDLPQEWIDTLIFNLAVVMGPEYDCPTERYNLIKTLAAEFLDDLSGWDREPQSSYFGVDFTSGAYT